MEIRQFRFEARRKLGAVSVALAVLFAGAIVDQVSSRTAQAATQEKQGMGMATESKFYCNSKALSPVERTRHKELTDKLGAARNAIVETEKGYEFRFSPSDVSLTELATWVGAESRCCPFFDFHIDLEREGSLLCLRLTGEEGIKPFIRSEFQVPAK